MCAGAGGLTLGLQDAGFDVLGVELDEDAAETHRRNLGPCDTADVTTWSPPGPVDVVVGGVPCQPFSAAGDRKGFADDRGQLFRHLLRIAVEARARVVVMENVRGLTTWRDAGGTAVRQIERVFREHGFDPVSQVLCAADYGVPQNRYRVFIVGFRDAADRAAFRWPSPTHGRPGNLLGLPPWVTVRQALRLGRGAFRAGRIDGASGWNGQRELDVDEPAVTVTTRNNADLIAGVLDAPAATVSAGGTEGGGGPEPFANADYRDALSRDLASAEILDRPCTTVTTRHDVPPHGNHARKLPAVRLTAAQCARLQDFPEGFLFFGDTATSVHRQIGNAVPRGLARAVALAIRAALTPTAARGAA